MNGNLAPGPQVGLSQANGGSGTGSRWANSPTMQRLTSKFQGSEKPSVLNMILIAALVTTLIALIAIAATRKSSDGNKNLSNTRFRAYELSPTDRPSYSLRFELSGEYFSEDLRSLESDKYLRFMHKLEKVMNRMISGSNGVDTKKDRSKWERNGEKYSQMTFLKNSSNGLVEAHFKIFADVYKLIIEENFEKTNVEKSQTSLIEDFKIYIYNLLESTGFKFGDYEVVPASIHITFHSASDFYPVGPEYGEDSQCSDIDFIMTKTGTRCISFLNTLKIYQKLNFNALVCQKIQEADHCFVEEIKPYRCSVETIHDGLMAILTGNGGYFVEDFDCPSACQSPHSFFDSILTNYCSDEVSLLRQNLIEDVKLDKACTLMNDMLRCGRRTLQKQSFCDTDLIEVSIRGLREKLVKEFDMDMLQCSEELCADGKLKILSKNILHGDSCSNFVYTLESAHNPNLSTPEFCHAYNGLVNCFKDEIDLVEPDSVKCLDKELREGLESHSENFKTIDLERAARECSIGTTEIEEKNVCTRMDQALSSDQCNQKMSDFNNTRFLTDKCQLALSVSQCAVRYHVKNNLECSFNDALHIIGENVNTHFGNFHTDMCKKHAGNDVQNENNIFNAGPTVFTSIIDSPMQMSTKLMSIDFFASFDNKDEAFDIFVLRPDTENSMEYKLIAKFTPQIMHKGYNSFDTSNLDIIMQKGDELAVYLKNKLSPIPYRSLDDFGEMNDDASDEEFRPTMKFKNIENRHDFILGQKIAFEGFDDKIYFPISFKLFQYTRESHHSTNSTTSSQQSMDSRTSYQPQQQSEQSAEVDEEKDYFSARNIHGKQTKCVQPRKFSSLHRLHSSELCDLNAIVSDDLILSCADLSQNCEQGYVASEMKSCHKFFSFMGCISDHVLSANQQCKPKYIADLNSNLRDYALNELNITTRELSKDCFAEMDSKISKASKSFPMHCHQSDDLLLDIIHSKCAFVPLEHYKTSASKCTASYTTATCVHQKLLEIGYPSSDCSLELIWDKLKEVSYKDSTYTLRDKRAKFSVRDCGDVDLVRSGKMQQGRNLKFCSDIEDLNKILTENCSQIVPTDGKYDCKWYDRLIRCMLSKSSGQNSCDYGSIDFLMKESNQFFIKNFNGFDPQVCDEGHERTDKSNCKPEAISAAYNQYCDDPQAQAAATTIDMKCNYLRKSMKCAVRNAKCKVNDGVRTVLFYAEYLRDTLGIDPLMCKYNDFDMSDPNLVIMDENKEQCENSPMTWISLQSDNTKFEKKFTDSYAENLYIIAELCSFVDNIAENVQTRSLESTNYYCSFRSLRDRFYDMYIPTHGIEMSNEVCMNVIGEISRRTDERCPKAIKRTDMIESGCLKLMKAPNQSTCDLTSESGQCFLNYLNNYLEYNCKYESMAELVMRDHKDFLIAQAEGHLKTCVVTYGTEFTLGITDTSKCKNAYSELDLENSRCLNILKYWDAGCEGLDMFVQCFAAYLDESGLACPIDETRRVLQQTQLTFIYYKSNPKLKQCIERAEENAKIEEMKEENMNRPAKTCETYYPESHLNRSQCLYIIQADSYDCNLWDEFAECFADYYNENVGECSAESIKATLMENQTTFLAHHASDKLSMCLKESTKNENSKCLRYYSEKMIEGTGCFELVQSQVRDCYLWQKFFTCFSDYYNNFEGDCEFEKIKGVLENDQLPFLRSQASDVMASCYKDFEPYETEAGQDGDHGNDGDHDNLDDEEENKFRCPDYFTERSLRSSSCQIILENPSGKCENLNEYAECLQNEMDRKYNFDCSLEGVKQRLVESSMGFIKFIAGEELQKNCFAKPCDNLNQNQIYDKCANELTKSDPKHSCDTIKDTFRLCNQWRSPFCDLNEVENYVFSSKKSQTEYYLRDCEDSSEPVEPCSDHKTISKILDSTCTQWNNKFEPEKTCKVFSSLLECTMNNLVKPEQKGGFECPEAQSQTLIEQNLNEFEMRLEQDISQCSTESEKAKETRMCTNSQDIAKRYENECSDDVVNSAFPGCNMLLMSILCMDINDDICPTRRYYDFFNEEKYLSLNELQSKGQCADVYCSQPSSIFPLINIYCDKPVDQFQSVCEHYEAVNQCARDRLGQMQNACSRVDIENSVRQFAGEYKNKFGYDVRTCLAAN